ncbi:hypothetical protein FQN50_009875 [Emmonsiellopsis sp. PD_5]|nr:hypothetical protein FQN50_009875 [Emmonsiellopsis sp. PD_5]
MSVKLDERQILTVASTWKFDKAGAEDVLELLKKTTSTASAAGFAFCKYEPTDNVFAVENCDINGSTSELGCTVSEYIDRQKDNDLLDDPKIYRIERTHVFNEDVYGNGTDLEEGHPFGTSTMGVQQPSQSMPTTKFWQSNARGLGCFEKFSYILDEISRLSGAYLQVEETDRRIRVSAPLVSLVDDALRRLDNLESSLSLAITPQITNILNVATQNDYPLRVRELGALDKKALRRILVDPDRKETPRVFRMFITFVNINPESPKPEIPDTLRTQLRNGRSKLWAHFRFQELGDVKNCGEKTTDATQQSQSGSDSGMVTARSSTVGSHRFLTQEKTTQVSDWVTKGVEAGAVGVNGSEPNSMPPPQLPAEEIEPPKQTIIKARRPVKSGAAAPAGPSTTKIENGGTQVNPLLSANFIQSAPVVKDPINQRPTPPTKTSSSMLIDLLDEITASTPAPPPMSLLDAPLIPIIPAKPMVQRSEATKMNGNAGCAQVERIREPETLVFHRTMGQKTGKKNATKAEKEAERDAKIAEAWGSPVKAPIKVTLTSASSFKHIEPSERKKGELAKMAQKFDATFINLLRNIEPVLSRARCFPGVVSLELQLGIILSSIYPSAKAEGITQAKQWNDFFQPKNNCLPPSTIFTNRLTSSGADIDDILLNPPNRTGPNPLFFEEPLSRRVTYELHCTTKNNEQLIISVDGSGATIVNRPESTLGGVNTHCAGQFWDMRAVVKGTIEYVGNDDGINKAIQDLIDKLYVSPNKHINIYTRTSAGIRVDEVFMKRSTRHGCFRQEKEAAPTESNRPQTPSQAQGPRLQITEVQHLISGISNDGTVSRHRGACSKDMVNDSRLWYEVSVICSPSMEEALRSNKDIAFGNPASWSTANLVRAFETGTSGSVKSDLQNGLDRTPLANDAGHINPKELEEMFSVGNKIVQKIDGVGWNNHGPCLPNAQEAEAARAASVAAAAQSQLGGVRVAGTANLTIGSQQGDEEVFW